MPFIPHTDAQRTEMLDTLGLSSLDELFRDIPADKHIDKLDLPIGRSEWEVFEHLHGLSRRNAGDLLCFIGGGFYDHTIPAAIDTICSRTEFLTAYTPYQPESSQGVLQAIFEYQSMIARLTGMDVANASLYDGGTALYEAAMLAVRTTGRRRILLDSGVNPIYRNMLTCYTSNLALDFGEIPVEHGQSNRPALDDMLNEDTAAVILQNPNFFGAVDDFTDIVARAHAKGCMVIMSVYPISLGMLKSPSAMGADIVTGEGQSLGIPLSFGGPYLGFMAVRRKLARKMPGRLIGVSADGQGRRGFVMTLQTREQHIRREKATSNICTNEALCAVRATVYLALMGRTGLAELASLCARKAEYAKTRLADIPDVTVKKSAPTFNEFTLELPCNASDVVSRMIDRGFAAGFPLGRYYSDMENYLLVAVTEKRTREQIGMFAEALEAAL